MSALKRIGIILIVGTVLALISSSFLVVPISKRAIIVGMGIDYVDNQYVVMCEVLSAESSSDTPGTSTTIVISGVGETITDALEDIHVKTGQLPSLGQCCVVLLGESIYKYQQMNLPLSLFTHSVAFKDNTVIACFDGNACQAISATTAVTPSPSFALSQLIQGSQQRTSIPKSTLIKFISKQHDNPSMSGYLSVVTFTPDQQINDDKTKHTQGYFDCKSIAVFTDYMYAGTVSGDEYHGFGLVTDKTFHSYIVNDEQGGSVFPPKASVGIFTKRLNKDVEWQGQSITFTIKCNLRIDRTNTDETGKLFKFINKSTLPIDNSVLVNTRDRVTEQINKTYQFSQQLKCDYLEISNMLYQKYGSEWLDYVINHPNSVFEDVTLDVQVEVTR
ncbi:MAG: Ger(x)C family spore germination C-terminal domain-containing protein [Clostridia bacterium]|nr:Ger(x)C family spore germination C-terminal domain-containing protein [Clostridia bacterium]